MDVVLGGAVARGRCAEASLFRSRCDAQAHARVAAPVTPGAGSSGPKEPPMRRHSPWISTIALTAAFVATAAGDPTIDASKSSIIATFRQESVPVDAPLKKFNGRIDYNAAA